MVELKDWSCAPFEFGHATPAPDFPSCLVLGIPAYWVKLGRVFLVENVHSGYLVRSFSLASSRNIGLHRHPRAYAEEVLKLRESLRSSWTIAC